MSKLLITDAMGRAVLMIRGSIDFGMRVGETAENAAECVEGRRGHLRCTTTRVTTSAPTISV